MTPVQGLCPYDEDEVPELEVDDVSDEAKDLTDLISKESLESWLQGIRDFFFHKHFFRNKKEKLVELNEMLSKVHDEARVMAGAKR